MTWDDTRIETAYRGLAAHASSAGVADSVAEAMRQPGGQLERTRARSWRAWLTVAAVLVLVAVGVGVTTIPHASGGPGNRGLNHYHAEGIDFDYPASWSIHDQLPASSGFGQTWAVLGTHAWPASCGPSDINCYYEAKLKPGTIQVEFGLLGMPESDVDLCTRGAAGTDLQGRGPGDPKPTQTLTRVAGRPALRTIYAVNGNDYYGSDEWLNWEIAPVGTVDEAYFFRARYLGPGVDSMKAEVDALITSIRLTPSQISTGVDSRADCGPPFPAVGTSSPRPSESDLAGTPASSCAGARWPATTISCDTAFRIGSQAGARVDRARIWLTTLAAVKASMQPVKQVVEPADTVQVWVIVYDGLWRCCPNAFYPSGSPIPAVAQARWLVVAEAAKEGTGFIYLQDWSGRSVPDLLPVPAS